MLGNQEWECGEGQRMTRAVYHVRDLKRDIAGDLQSLKGLRREMSQ